LYANEAKGKLDITHYFLYAKNMKQNKKIHKKVAKVFNHRGFIAISMFSLGVLLPAMIPAFNSDALKKGCSTQTSPDGNTTITNCTNESNQQNEVNNNTFVSSGSGNPVTVNLPKLPKFCKYVTGAQGITISCASPLPSNMPISIPPMRPVQVALPTLPPNCQYQTSNGTPAIHCTTPSGTMHITGMPMKPLGDPFNNMAVSPTPTPMSIQHNPIASFFSSVAKFLFGFGK
jgi:hypothetical protein